MRYTSIEMREIAEGHAAERDFLDFVDIVGEEEPAVEVLQEPDQLLRNNFLESMEAAKLLA